MRHEYLLIAFVLAFSTIAYAGNDHCHYYSDTGNGIAMDIGFDKPSTELPVANPNKRVFVVPEGASLTLGNITQYVLQCVDGARSNAAAPVRVLEINPDGATAKPFLNAYQIVGGEACEGGSVVIGTGSATSQPFNLSGTYNLRIEYSTHANPFWGQPSLQTDPSLAGLSVFIVLNELGEGNWKFYKDIEVRVVPGAVTVSPAIGTSIGLQKNIYEKEDSKRQEFYWNVHNSGGVDVELLEVNSPEGFCNNPNISSCEFPQRTEQNRCVNCFSPGMLLKPDENIWIKEIVNVKRPTISPTKERLSINIKFQDATKTAVSNTSVKVEPLPATINFRAVAAAIAPYSKEGTFDVEPDTTYHMQMCTDSPYNGFYDSPLETFQVFDEGGNKVAERTFHSVAYPNPYGRCDDPITLRNYNRNIVENGIEGGLYTTFKTPRFNIGEMKRTYRWKLGGIVGVNDPLIGNYYTQDFARISKWFDDKKQLVVDRPVQQGQAGNQQNFGYALDTSLGPQHFAKDSRDILNAGLNIFEGTKQLALFAPKITEQPHGPIFFGFQNTSITSSADSFSRPEFNNTSLSDGSTDLFFLTDINALDNNPLMYIFARTSLVNRSIGAHPLTDVNLLWVDREKYMLELKVGAAGVCRDLQNAVISSGKSQAITGGEVAPKVKYDWRPQSFDMKSCSPENPNYIVCDATQFSYVLLKKLGKINNLIGQGKGQLIPIEADFNAFIMRDGFSADFRDDFDEYYSKFFKSDDLNYKSVDGDSSAKWDKYFAKDKGRLVFRPENILQPGLYNVRLVFRFGSDNTAGTSGDIRLFDEHGNAIARIEVHMSKISNLPADVLYYLPIDGSLGQKATEVHRDGYGVGFNLKARDNSIIIFDPADKDFLVQTNQISADSRPVAYVDVNRVSSLIQLTKNNPGQLLLISKKEGQSLSEIPQYSLMFAPSLPVPVVIGAQPNRSIIAAEYVVKEGDIGVEAGDYLARLVEIGTVKNNVLSCTDDTAANAYQLPAFVKTDRQRATLADQASSCRLVNGRSNTKSIYGFSRGSSSDKGLLFETVFYAPSKGSISILNACQDQGYLYIPTYEADAQISGFKRLDSGEEEQLDNPASAVYTLAQAIDKIRNSNACFAYGTEAIGEQFLPNNAGIWWNESVIVKSFRDRLQNQGINVNACFES